MIRETRLRARAGGTPLRARARSVSPAVPLALAWLLAAVPAVAQAPHASSLFPPGLQRGTAATVTLFGDNLDPHSRLLVSGSGVSAAIDPVATRRAVDGVLAARVAKMAPVAPVAPVARPAAKTAKKSVVTVARPAVALAIRLTAAADAPPGVRELRVLGPKGGSNAARFEVGDLPELVEKEPNDSPAQAMPVDSLPATISGRIDPATDVDSFRMHAGAGETWVFQLAAARLGSPLDGFLTLRDAHGEDLASAVEEGGRDAQIVHTFAAATDVTVVVRDVAYHGGPEYVYRLTAGRLPAVAYTLPLAVTRGRPMDVRLMGAGLDAGTRTPVDVPAGFPKPTVQVWPTVDGRALPPVTLMVSSMPELVAAAPGHAWQQAEDIPSLPSAISGVLRRPGTADFYRFTVPRPEKMTLEVFARRLGSRMDSYLRVIDASGKEIASNDDAAGKDSRLTVDLTAPGAYYAAVNDLPGGGGDGYFYRLAITPTPQPDFALRLTPDVLNIGRGGTGVLTLAADRANGFDGRIVARVAGLPAGIVASPAILGPGQAGVPITLTAQPQAAMGAFAIGVRGTADVGGRRVQREAQPMEAFQPPGANSNSQRPVEFELAGVGDPPPFTLELLPAQVTLPAGGTVRVKIVLHRLAGNAAATGDADLQVQNAPDGLSIDAPTIAAGKSDGTLTLKAKAGMTAETAVLIVTAGIKNIRLPAPALIVTIAPKGK